MTIELQLIHNELTEIADEFGLNPPKDFEHYLSDVEDFELMNDLIDEDYQMMSIQEIESKSFDGEAVLDEESELIF